VAAARRPTLGEFELRPQREVLIMFGDFEITALDDGTEIASSRLVTAG
jgi:hypothetical protein